MKTTRISGKMKVMNWIVLFTFLSHVGVFPGGVSIVDASDLLMPQNTQMMPLVSDIYHNGNVIITDTVTQDQYFSDVYDQTTSGNIYYVSSSSGDNKNDGSEANPFASVRYAKNLLQAGDTLYIGEGFYTEGYIEMVSSGTEDAYINIIGVGNVVFDGTDADDTFKTKGHDYIRFMNLEINNARQAITINTGSHHIVVDGLKTDHTRYAVYMKDASDIIIRNAYVTRSRYSFRANGTTHGVLIENDIMLREEELLDTLNAPKNEPNSTYVVKITNAVNQGIAHYWYDQGIDKYHLRIPLWENYLLYFASYIYPKRFRKYRFYDYKKTITRGVGFCGEQSSIVWSIMEKNHLKSKIIRLGGHTVAMTQVDKEHDQWWILDPDYGVVIEHSLGEIEKSPEIIRPYYAEKGYDENLIQALMIKYAKEENRTLDSDFQYRGWKIAVAEKTAYALKWLLPLMFMVFGLFSLTSHRSPKNATKV